jgi:type VI secretion system secreted protein VgrG
VESDDDFFSLMGLPKELVTSNRPLRLRLDLPGGVNDDLLLPQRVFGTEALCGGIEYRVLCVSISVSLPLKQLIAVPAALDFVTDQGELRSVCGIVTEASSGDSDGGLASYQLVIRDALAILEKRTNTRVFRNMDEVEIVRRILNEWRQKSAILGVCFSHEADEAFAQRTYPAREFTMQHNESDAAFIRRLLSRRGIGWYIRAGTDTELPTHALVLFNNADSLRRNAAGTVRYHRDGATEERDAITSWSAVRTLQPGVVTRHSWNYRNPLGRDFMMMDAASNANQGVHGNELAASLDDYQILSPHAGDDNEDLCKLGLLRMTRHDYESKCFHGEGSVRDLCAGEYFTLADHPEVDEHAEEERDFVVTALRVAAQNNLPKALAARVERLFARSRWGADAQDFSAQREAAQAVADGPLRMHVQFTAVRRGVNIVPSFDARTDLPPALMQSAIVVGPAGEEVHCDQLGRVKIRFPGTRPADHEQANGAGTLDTEADSAWVRVASNWAGNGPGSLQQCGTVGLPRIGTEVLVNFLGGDPDKPVIVGQLYNEVAEPAGLSNAGNLPGNRYLSGIKSREIHGDRGNQLRLDDSNGEISAQIASDHANSHLNLGYLTQPRSEGRGELRGEGAELRSDMAVTVRGAGGVLISANSGGGPTGPHLERKELNRILSGFQMLGEQLSKLAERIAAEDPQGNELKELAEKVSELHEGGKQLVAIDGPMGVAVASGQSLLLGAVTDIDIASSGDTRISAAGRGVMHAGLSLGLFANRGDVKITAASGKVMMQASNAAMLLLAKQVLDIISTTDWINITAKQGIRINGGGTELVISADGIQGYTSASFEMNAAEHHFKGPSSKAAKFPGSTVCPTQTAAAAQSGSAAVPLKG